MTRFRSLLGAALVSAVAVLPVQAEVKIALDSKMDDTSGTYVWAKAFHDYLSAHGIESQLYQRGALGGDDELFDQISQGLLEVSMSPLGITGSIDKLVYGLRLPYFWNDMAQIDRALGEGGMLAAVNAPLEPEGVKIAAVVPLGAGAGIFNTKHPVTKVADMADLRMRALDESQIELFKAWGSNGTVVSWAEVPNALQTGVADGYLNPDFVPLLFGHTDFIKHFTDADLVASLRVALFSQDWYAGLSDADRATVDAAAAEADRVNREWLARPTDTKQKLEAAGVAVVKLTPEAFKEFQDASRATWTSGLLTPEQLAQWEAAKGK